MLDKVSLKKYKELEENSNMKELLFDILSHDLLNPAGIAMNFVELLNEKELDGESREFTRIIGRNIDKIIELINDIKTFSKCLSIDSLDTKEINLKKVWENVIDELEPIIRKKKIKVKLESEKCIITGSMIIKEVFVNLLSNALKYSGPDTNIEVITKENHRNCYIEVRDEGSGIEDKYKESIFERFTRGDKQGVRGSGLGLAIVKSIVEMHNGKVWVEDNIPRGSIFKVILPKNEHAKESKSSPRISQHNSSGNG